MYVCMYVCVCVRACVLAYVLEASTVQCCVTETCTKEATTELYDYKSMFLCNLILYAAALEASRLHGIFPQVVGVRSCVHSCHRTHNRLSALFALHLVTLALTRVFGPILFNSCDSDTIDLIDPHRYPVCVPILKQIWIMK